MIRLETPAFLFFVVLSISVSLLCGCGGFTVTPPPPAASITITPAFVALSAGRSQPFTAHVTGMSSTAVTWSVIGCIAETCGTITADGVYTAPPVIPSAANVTVQAILQADTTRSATATVRHVPLSIDIPETSVRLNAGETYSFTANVLGHPNTAVNWSLSGCTIADCGAVSGGVYTAPPTVPEDATVSVVATSAADLTKSDSVQVNLAAIAVQIFGPGWPWVTIDPDLGAAQDYYLTAGVTGTSNTAVTWSLTSCTDPCGTITNGLYTAPSYIANDRTVTVVATSQADPTKSASAIMRLHAVAVSVGPRADPVIVAGAALELTATVTYDSNNAGVTWGLNPGCTPDTCGALSNVTPTSATYTAPASIPDPSTVPVTATSVTDPAQTGLTTIHISATPPLKEGDYAYFFDGWDWFCADYVGCYWYRRVVAGHFHADTGGQLTSGIQDINAVDGVRLAVPFTGSYVIGTERTGTFTVTDANGTFTYNLAVDSSGTKATFSYMGLGAPGMGLRGSGRLESQDKAAFSLPVIAGDYALGAFGSIAEEVCIAGVGRFSVDAAGVLSAGKMDMAGVAACMPQNSYPNLTLTGSLSPPDPATGRGIATLSLTPQPGPQGTFNFAYYVTSEQKLRFVQTDVASAPMPLLSGEARRQSGPFSLASFHVPAIFSMGAADLHQYMGTFTASALGQMLPDGNGHLGGIIDLRVMDGNSSNEAFTGSYTIESNGRSTMTFQRPSGPDSETAYFYGPNEGFLMQTSGQVLLFGRFKPQSGGPYNAASVNGSFLIGSRAPMNFGAHNIFGSTAFDGIDAATADLIAAEGLLGFGLSGTYTVAPNGRGTVVFTSTDPDQSLVFWIISPTQLAGIATVNPDDYQSALLDFER